MKQDPKKMKKVKALAKAADKKPAMPFWMKSKMGMKKAPSDNDGDE
jgi:hypothetical protein